MTTLRTYTVVSPRVEARDGTGSIPLNVKQLTVSLDATWSPYAQATVTCAQPSGTALTSIEPRTGLRLRFTLRQTESSGTITDRVFDLCLRSRALAWVAQEMTLTAASDESLLQDYARGTPLTYTTAQNTTALVTQAVNFMPQTLHVETGAPDVSVAAGDGDLDPGVNAWDYSSQLAEAAGAWFYVDELAAMHWAAPGWTASSGTRYLNDTAHIIDVQDTVSRDETNLRVGWASMVVVAYTGNSPVQYVYDSAGTDQRKTITVTRNRRKPAGNAATKMRTAAQKRGRNLIVSALAEVVAAPNQTWSVAYGDQSRSGTVQAVTFNMPEGTMDLTLNT